MATQSSLPQAASTFIAVAASNVGLASPVDQSLPNDPNLSRSLGGTVDSELGKVGYNAMVFADGSTRTNAYLSPNPKSFAGTILGDNRFGTNGTTGSYYAELPVAGSATLNGTYGAVQSQTIAGGGLATVNETTGVMQMNVDFAKNSLAATSADGLLSMQATINRQGWGKGTLGPSMPAEGTVVYRGTNGTMSGRLATETNTVLAVPGGGNTVGWGTINSAGTKIHAVGAFHGADAATGVAFSGGFQAKSALIP